MTNSFPLLRNLRSSFLWAWLDIKCKYRRSMIGPFWETINVFVIIMGISYVSSIIFRSQPSDNIPLVGLGIIVWTAISALLIEGGQTFILNKENIKNSNLTLDLYAGRTIFRVFITSAHHMLLYFVGLLFLPLHLDANTALSLVGVIFLLINSFWAIPTLGLLCARFRDMEMIIRSFLQLAFFVTPVFWHPGVVTDDRVFIIDYNPLYYFLEAIRGPLLGEVPSMMHYIILTGITVSGYVIFWLVYRSLRRNLSFFV